MLCLKATHGTAYSTARDREGIKIRLEGLPWYYVAHVAPTRQQSL